MGHRAKEKKKSSRQPPPPRNVAQTVDAGEEQPDTRRQQPKNGDRKRNNNTKKKTRHCHHHEEIDEDAQLTKSLAEHNLEFVEVSPDGNCLFRALSDQLYGDYGNDHANIRSEICDFMEKNKQDFEEFVVVLDDNDKEEKDARDFEHYIEKMREDGTWGADIEITAAARLYKRNISVYSATLNAYTFPHRGSKSRGPELALSFHGHDNHYNSVRIKGSPPKKIDVNLNCCDEDLERNEKFRTASDSPIREKKTSADPPGTRAGRKKSRDSSAEVSEGSQQNISIVEKPIRKNNPCPCGSNLRYKKCCLAKQKLAARTRKEREKMKVAEDEEDEVSASTSQQNTTAFQRVTI